MKNFLLCIALAAIAFLTSCALDAEQRGQLLRTGVNTIRAADTNNDGVISSSEVSAAPGNLNVIGGLMESLLLLFAGGGAAYAMKKAASATAQATAASAEAARISADVARHRVELDEVYDEAIKKKA